MDNSIILKTLNMVIKNISNMVKYGHPKTILWKTAYYAY